MKTLSNTSIAAVFAVGLTLLVALMSLIPFFADKETQTTDEMLHLRYEIHQRFSPIKPDNHLVVAAIDQKSLDTLGRWPFRRDLHGDFLTLLAPEKPRAVAWDIFFTEAESVDTSAPPSATANPAPADSAPAAPPTASPSPAMVASPPKPTDSTAAPSGSPVAPTPTPSATPATAPESPNPPPANPSPSSPNAPTPAAPPAPEASTNAASAFSPFPIPIGDDMTSNAASSAAPASAATVPPANAVVPPPAPAPDASTPAPPASTTASSPSTPAAATPPPDAATPAPAPATATAPSDAAPSLTADDQGLVDGASLFPSMVTAAERSTDPQPPLSPEDMLPTRPLTHVRGDTSKLLSSKYAVLPFPALRKETYFGFADENGENGGGSRRNDPLMINIDGKILPSFDLQTLMQFWGVDPDQVNVTLGREITLPRPDGTVAHIPIDEKGQMTLNYRGRLEDFQTLSYSLMLHGLYDKSQGQKTIYTDHLPPIKDNLLVVGVTFAGTDAGPTPLENNAPLVVTHLNALNNILQGDFLRPVSPWIWMPIYALFLFATGTLMLRVGIAPMIPMGIFAVVVLAVVGIAALWFNYSMPIATPEIGVLLLAGAVPTKRFFGEEREKMKVKKAMSSYLSEKVMNKILANPDGVKLGGVKQVITIMFCDIRGFTAYCDNRDPQEVLNVVNEYFEEMTKVVFKYEGTVDKYIGDCIMAFWNAPEDQPDHAQRAVCCAMEMRYALANFKVRRAGLDTELFECGIGIHTGEALVGNMGSTLKVNYTAMGSTVNLGARLEALTKKLNERILISQATFEQLTGDFPITDRGEAIVPGFANPIHVYGVGAEQDLGSAIAVGLKLAKKQDYTAEEVTKPIWAPAPLPEDADPNP